jgi:hypothetical protein
MPSSLLVTDVPTGWGTTLWNQQLWFCRAVAAVSEDVDKEALYLYKGCKHSAAIAIRFIVL